ncbi:MAG: hypothetical protein EBZ50_06945 [Alphaproteobacteria bacterium]|nr:hypothetical protein [Alphaproteobacteria bacterium]
MNLKLVFAAAAGLALLSTPAFAADLGAVKLAAPVQKTVKVIADSAVYICNGDACSGAAQKPPTVRGCKAIAKEAGAVVSYTSDGKSLAADDLAKCNAAVEAKAAAAATLAAN